MPDLPSHFNTPPVFWYTNVAFIIFAIYIYSSVFTYLQHICKEKICAIHYYNILITDFKKAHEQVKR